MNSSKRVGLVLYCTEAMGEAWDVHYLKMTYQYAVWKSVRRAGPPMRGSLAEGALERPAEGLLGRVAHLQGDLPHPGRSCGAGPWPG